jgi:hypothetical protein
VFCFCIDATLFFLGCWSPMRPASVTGRMCKSTLTAESGPVEDHSEVVEGWTFGKCSTVQISSFLTFGLMTAGVPVLVGRDLTVVITKCFIFRLDSSRRAAWFNT